MLPSIGLASARSPRPGFCLARRFCSHHSPASDSSALQAVAKGRPAWCMSAPPALDENGGRWSGSGTPRIVRTTTKPSPGLGHAGSRRSASSRLVRSAEILETGPTMSAPGSGRAAPPLAGGLSGGAVIVGGGNLPDVAPSGCRGSQGACGPQGTRPLTLDAHVSLTPSDVRLTSLAVRPTSAGRSDCRSDQSSAG